MFQKVILGVVEKGGSRYTCQNETGGLKKKCDAHHRKSKVFLHIFPAMKREGHDKYFCFGVLSRGICLLHVHSFSCMLLNDITVGYPTFERSPSSRREKFIDITFR